MAYKFPKNRRFRRLAARLADAVTLAINTRYRITCLQEGTPDVTCRCPLGCLTGSNRASLMPNFAVRAFPPAAEAAWVWGCTEDEAGDFITGFESGDATTDCILHENFYQLGLAYRKRFVEV